MNIGELAPTLATKKSQEFLLLYLKNISRIVVIKFAKIGKTDGGDFSVGREEPLGFPSIPALPFHSNAIILFTNLCLMNEFKSSLDSQLLWER